MENFKAELTEARYTIIEMVPQEGNPYMTWFHFFKDGYMGYVQKSMFSGFDYSTAHKPSRQHGTGSNCIQNVESLSLMNAALCLHRQRYDHREDIKLWLSPKEFIESEKILRYRIFQNPKLQNNEQTI